MKLAARLLSMFHVSSHIFDWTCKALNNPAEFPTQRQHYPSPSPVASSSQLTWREFDQNAIPLVPSSVRFPTRLTVVRMSAKICCRLIWCIVELREAGREHEGECFHVKAHGPNDDSIVFGLQIIPRGTHPRTWKELGRCGWRLWIYSFRVSPQWVQILLRRLLPSLSAFDTDIWYHYHMHDQWLTYGLVFV